MNSAANNRTLYILNPGDGQIVTCDENGENINVVQDKLDKLPDGIVLDNAAGKVYFTQMGKPNFQNGTAYGNDGSIWSMNLNGTELTCLVEPGQTRTPKQITADFGSGKLYWCDREGMRVMRCNLDGSGLETLVETGQVPEHEKDQSRWCVGVAVDANLGHIYWTQKGASDSGTGKICRAGLNLPAGESPNNRSDIEILFKDLPEPIDLELDTGRGFLYWTDRGDLPGGNSVCRAKFHDDHTLSKDFQVLVEGTGETIGFAFDHQNGKLFITSVTGDLYRADIDGGKPERIAKFKMLTGIALL